MLRAALISICLICSAVSADTPVVYEDYKLIASDGTSNDYFGDSVSISDDGTTAIIGAPYDDNNGSAYIYQLVSGVWEETNKLTASGGPPGDDFGASVSISDDGTTAIIGALNDDDNGSASGSAYIYVLVSGVWQETKLLASDGIANDQFGTSVSISGDGTTAIVGAYFDGDNGTYAGSAYIYSLVKGAWQETKILASDGVDFDEFGTSVSISDDGTTCIVGAPHDDDNAGNSGASYVYEFISGAWQETKLIASDGTASDRFGKSVSISDDGTTALVGAFYDDDNGFASGSAYIYELIDGTWQETKLLANDGEENAYFGDSVSISGDGTIGIVGAYWEGTDSAYIYELIDETWQETKLLASDGTSNNYFGHSVSISGDGATALVGAPRDDGNANSSGSSYIYFVGEPIDTDGDGVPDDIDNCYLYNPDQADCNGNGIGDICDVADSTSFDCDQNNVPDECQPDCDGDGWIDACDSEGDCDDDGIPDNCELDCNGNSIPDDCDIIYGISEDCNENGVPDECDLADGTEEDCNLNGLPDSCDIADGTEEDCDENGMPDSCGLASAFQETHYFDGWYAGFNGETAIIDATDLLDSGTAALQIYTLVDSNWIEEDYIPLEVNFINRIKMDQNIAVVEGPGEGSAYNSSLLIFRFNGTQWVQEAHIQTPDPWAGFGFLGRYEISNNRIIVSGYNNHIAYIYMFNGTEWILEAELNPFADSSYDSELSVDIDGDTVVLGAWGLEDLPGVVYIYKFNGSKWTEETSFSANDPVNGDGFGYYVQLDGEHLAVSNTIAYLYHFEGSAWILKKQIEPIEDQLYANVHFDGDTAIVFATNELNPPTPLSVYDFEEGNWLLKSEIVSNNEDDSYFGSRTQLHGDVAMISGNGRNYIYTNQIQSDFDCNSNGVLDECELNSENDLNNNGVLDECECFADINLDGYVNVNDLLIIIGYWGNNTPQADLNFDGIVDVTDLLIVVGNWGECE